MPFDGTTPTKTEIDVLDEMKIILSSPKSWGKHRLQSFHNDNAQYCLIGALNLVDHNNSRYLYSREGFRYDHKSSLNVLQCLAEVISTTKMDNFSINVEGHVVANFNNDPTTNHHHILDLLEKARQKFIAEQE